MNSRAKVLTEAPTPMYTNLLKRYVISLKQLCQHMDSRIILGAFDLHHSKVFASK